MRTVYNNNPEYSPNVSKTIGFFLLQLYKHNDPCTICKVSRKQEEHDDNALHLSYIKTSDQNIRSNTKSQPHFV